MGVFELIGRHGLNILPVGLGSGFCIVHHEGQFKYFNPRETARCIAGQCPNNVDNAIARLVVQLNRCTAQLHGGVGFKLNATARFFFNLVHPCFVHVEPHIGLWRHEGVKLQCDCLLGKSRNGWGADGGYSTRL